MTEMEDRNLETDVPGAGSGTTEEEAGKRVLLAGLGNVGSVVAELLARHPGVSRLVVVDFDDYEPANLRGAVVRPSEVGKKKAQATASRIAPLGGEFSGFKVEPRTCTVEALPWGDVLKADVVVSCLDNRASRAYLAGVAYRLGRPFVDAGLVGDGALVRVSVMLPAHDGACPYCILTPEELAVATAADACLKAGAGPATGAAAHLGAIVGGLEVRQVEQVMGGNMAMLADGGTQLLGTAADLVFDVDGQQCVRTFQTRNPDCRAPHESFGEIEAWSLSPAAITLGDVLDTDDAWLAMPGQIFSTRELCDEGAHRLHHFRPLSRPRLQTDCSECPGNLTVDQSEIHSRLTPALVPQRRRRLSFRQLGIGDLDVISIGRGEQVKHYMFDQTQRLQGAA